MKLGLLNDAKIAETRADFYLKDDGDGDVSVGVLINNDKNLKLGFFTANDGKITLHRYSFYGDEAEEFINRSSSTYQKDGNLIEVI